MRPLCQILRKVESLLLYLFFYLLGACIIVAFWGYIYNKKGILYSYTLSLEIFLGLENSIPKEIIKYAYIEKISYDLFSIVLVGTVLIKFLEPLNPIQFAKYMTYDTVDRQIVFRYWIMLPKGKYLYDAKIKILLTDYESHQRGINKLEVFWKPDESRIELDQIRGIRFIELTEKESSDLIKSVEGIIAKHIDDEGNYIGGKYAVDLSIQGTSEYGTTYYGWKRYTKERILIGYKFVPLQRHTYASKDFYRETYLSTNDRKKTNASEDFYKEGKKEFFRYQHFDKVYKQPNSAKSVLAKKEKNILSKKQIISGQYWKPLQICVDFLSFNVWFFLDSDRKIRWIFHKLCEYILHVLRIKRC